MTTEPKAEGGEAVNPRSIDSLAWALSRFPMAAIVRALDKAVPGFAASYLRPAEVTPSAVEALAMAADAIAERISYYAELGEHASTNIEDWAYTDGSGDIARLRAALAHPEIAALLKGEKA